MSNIADFTISNSLTRHLRRAFACCVLGLAGFYSAPDAMAGGHNNCIRYSDTAVQQQRRNLRRNCGFSGPRWHNDKAAHYAWCRIADRAARNAGTAHRRNKLRTCRNGGGNIDPGWDRPLRNKRAQCRTYADGAMQIFRRAQRNRCGLNGGLWHTNSNSHFNWCMGVSRAQRNARAANRRRALNSCLANRADQLEHPPLPERGRLIACNSYANRAVSTSRRARRDCGITDGQFHTNRNRHFNWCMTAAPNARRTQNQTRTRRLRQCRAAQNVNPAPRLPSLRGLSANCERYANDAVYNSVLRIELLGGNRRCAPRSPIWSTSFPYHYNGCLSTSRGQRAHNAANRANVIAHCRARR